LRSQRSLNAKAAKFKEELFVAVGIPDLGFLG
jgi:hypothetical protein